MTTTSRPSYGSHVPGHAQAPLPLPGQTQQSNYDYRYEFSETRKVLEEFFKAENEFPDSPPTVTSSQTRNSYTDSIHPGKQYRGHHVSAHVPPETDLDYSLTRLEVSIDKR